MSRLPVRRNSQCLFCAFAARSPLQPHRLLPRIQTAQRTGGQSKKKSKAVEGKPSNFDPFVSKQPFRPRDEQQPFRLRGESGPFHTVRDRLEQLKTEFTKPDFLAGLQLSREEFDREWLKFERSINIWIKQATPEVVKLAREDQRKKSTLERRLRYMFYSQACGGNITSAELKNQKEVADLRYPAEWYPATRELPRTVHMHVGPTNSGKTYHALKRLEEVDSGIYLGPLRLLAHEVYTRLNAKGKPCALVTGEEQRMPEAEIAKMFSCTVEMAPLNTEFQVAVIDEIQMINHPERGWAWTQAFLGLQANEIHLCGEARTVPLMRELCALAGDKVHVHEYERLTPLKVEPNSLGRRYDKLEKGDCVVAFSILGIHALRREIEKVTKKKCAIVYGSLPPESRAQQARLFNDPDNEYDYLVASDAIGMGLNLAIKRVIFDTTVKSNGVDMVPLQISEIKQIAGRAGRFKTAHQAITKDSQASVADTAIDPAIGLDDKKPVIVETQKSEPKTVGWCTTFDDVDLPHLRNGMKREPEEIKTAGLFPPSLVIERFANYFPPGTPFSYIMLRLHEISELHPRFHLCALKDQITIADTIHPVKNLSVQDRIVICAAPINTKDSAERDFIRSLAKCIADGTSGSLLDLDTLPLHFMDLPSSRDRTYLRKLEQLHKMIVCYLWLSYRFPNVFTTRSLASYTKKVLEDQIETTLKDFSFTEQARQKMQMKREAALRQFNSNPEGTTTEDGQPIPAPPGLPNETKDIVNDPQLADDQLPPSDDEGELYGLAEENSLRMLNASDEATQQRV